MIDFNILNDNNDDQVNNYPDKLLSIGSGDVFTYNDDINKIVNAFHNSCDDIHFIQHKNFSLHELVQALIKSTKLKGFDMTLSSFAFTELPTRSIGMMKDEGYISSINLLTDVRAHANYPGVLQQLYQICDNIAIDKVHAKICVLTHQEQSIIILGSANWTTNQRFEFGMISKNKGLAEFYKNFILKSIEIQNEHQSR